jgi:hypothetical protein
MTLGDCQVGYGIFQKSLTIRESARSLAECLLGLFILLTDHPDTQKQNDRIVYVNVVVWETVWRKVGRMVAGYASYQSKSEVYEGSNR